MDLHGNVNLPSNNKISYDLITLSTKALTHKRLSLPVFNKLYNSLVASMLAFNPLPCAYDINKLISFDRSIIPMLRSHFHLLPTDPAHSIFLPSTLGGAQFRSLTSVLIESLTRELYVTANSPTPNLSTLTNTSIRQRLQAHILAPTSTNNFLSHPTRTCALLGFYLLPTTTPTINMAMSILQQFPKYNARPIGTPRPRNISNPILDPFTDLTHPQFKPPLHAR